MSKFEYTPELHTEQPMNNIWIARQISESVGFAQMFHVDVNSLQTELSGKSLGIIQNETRTGRIATSASVEEWKNFFRTLRIEVEKQVVDRRTAGV
jgi:hypothetical protein